MVRKTKTESAQTRERILDAAEYEMYERGVTHTSLERVAQRAEVTRGAIYWHFDDKTAILNAMVARTYLPLRDLRERLGEHIRANQPLRLLREMLIHSLQRLANDAQHRRVCHIVLHRCEVTSHNHPTQAMLAALFDDSRRSLAALCAQIERRGKLRANLTCAEATDVIIAFVCGNYECALRHSDVYELDRDWAPVVDAVLRGLFVDSARVSPLVARASAR